MRKHIPALALGLSACLGTGAAMAETSFSHEDWQTVLERFVDESGRVDYGGLAEDRTALDRYLEKIAEAGPESTPERFPDGASKLAYYVNAYNALVFDGVLREGPDVDSVWGWTGTGAGFFMFRRFSLDGRQISLKSLEDDLIRAGFEDPRIHAALNCASLGCPRLPREPFLAATLDEQLDAAMREFVTAEQGCSVDPAARKVSLSQIFDWFEGDFLAEERSRGVAEPTVLGYVNRYRPPDAKIPADFEIRYPKYDKRLNRQESQ